MRKHTQDGRPSISNLALLLLDQQGNNSGVVHAKVSNQLTHKLVIQLLVDILHTYISLYQKDTWY